MMPSKPPFHPKPKRRPPKRKPMTIAAGFVCAEGLVLFADTEEQQGYTKTNTDKVQEYDHNGCSAVIANAGHGFLADSLIDRIWEGLDKAKRANKDIIQSIRKTIVEFHKDEVALYPAENDLKHIGLVIGFQVSASPILIHADATALRKVKELAVIGYGAEIKYLAQQFYRYRMPIKHGLLVANYLVFSAKQHVQGCGGESIIATLTNQGVERRHFFDVMEDEQVFYAFG